MDVPRLEVIASFLLWIDAVCYSIYRLIKSCKVFENYDDVYGDFRQGWLIESVKKDAADYEWETMLKLLAQIYPWFIAHIFMSEYLRQKNVKALPYWQIFLPVLFITYSTGIIATGIIIAQPVVFECFHKFKSKLLVWTCAGIWLAIISYIKSLTIVKGQVQFMEVNETEHYMIVVTACWINLRCLSYYLDNLHTTEHSIIKMLAYCFYLPTLFLGPFIGFSNFEQSQKVSNSVLSSGRIKMLLFSLIRCGFWFLFTEFSLHYLYINALSFQPKVVESLDSWSLYGYGYCMGQFFHLKYVVMYGLSSALGKFEHIATPSTPKCIGRIHLYSDMWKYFDEGLYRFLLRYIYLPTLGDKSIGRKVFSSFLCFLFIFVWHGIYQHIFVWTSLNFLGILLETLFTSICNNLQNQLSRLSIWWKHILLCIITTPLLVMSAISNFYFFAGMQIGNIFVRKFIYGSVSSNLVLLFFLCCCCGASMEIKKWEKRKRKNCV